MLTGALAVVALVAGLAGAWSPCGLSMVETLAPAGYAGRRRTAAAGAAAFAVGALAGGAATFGGLAVAGAALGVGGGLGAASAVAALLIAAAGDAAGRRIVPQVRRQVPESWRRLLPVPLAAGLYGVLLGLGFTTFVLSFACWALAAACLAIGAPATGLATGLAFGAGRALPVLALAPLQDRDGPAAVAAAMAERPAVLRGLRVAAAAALAVAAVVLVAAPPAARAQAQPFADPGYDPSASAGLVAFQSGASGVLVRAGATVPLPGTHPAVAAGRVAYLSGDQVVVADAATLVPLAGFPAAGADAVALSQAAVAWRAPGAGGRDTILARRLDAPAAEAPAVAGVAPVGGTLGRPAADDTNVVFDSQARGSSRVLAFDLATGRRTTLRRATGGGLLLGPDADGGRLLYVRSTARRQQLRLGAFAPAALRADRVIHSTTPTARRDQGYERGKHPHHAGYAGGRRPKPYPRPPKGLTVTLWTTALEDATAYVTRVRHLAGGTTRARILSVPAGR